MDFVHPPLFFSGRYWVGKDHVSGHASMATKRIYTNVNQKRLTVFHMEIYILSQIQLQYFVSWTCIITKVTILAGLQGLF